MYEIKIFFHYDHKESNIYLWNPSTQIFVLGLLKKGYSYLKHKAFVWMSRAYVYELNLLGGAWSMKLKLSSPLLICHHSRSRIALYIEHVKSKWY